jgi:energy-coupling factor transporter ATP-binding protein EcfA2
VASDYVYTMYRADKFYGSDRQVLASISLSFLPGAKIGVLGPNGAGKSTLLRIMAGRDTEFRGEAQLAPGASVGLLEQEPQLDESKDVRGNVEDGVRELRDMLDRFNELAANYSDDTADEFARLQDRIDAADAWNLDSHLDQAMDALRLPPGDADVTKLSGGERLRLRLFARGRGRRRRRKRQNDRAGGEYAGATSDHPWSRTSLSHGRPRVRPPAPRTYTGPAPRGRFSAAERRCLSSPVHGEPSVHLQHVQAVAHAPA